MTKTLEYNTSLHTYHPYIKSFEDQKDNQPLTIKKPAKQKHINLPIVGPAKVVCAGCETTHIIPYFTRLERCKACGDKKLIVM